MTKKIGWILFMLPVLSICGCDQGGLEGLVPADGVVLYKDQPVENAYVSFSPKVSTENSSAASAYTDANGKFRMMTLNPGDGVYPGDYYVTVTKVQTEGDVANVDPSKGKTSMKDNRTTTQLLPSIYGELGSSGLDLTIPTEGKSDIEFRLTGEVDSTRRDSSAKK